MAVRNARSWASWAWVAGIVAAGIVASCTSSSTTCATGETGCPSGCSNLLADPLNCGACGTACVAGSSCVSGVCTCPPPSDKVCGGVCVQSQTDVSNCGTCGHQCGLGTCGGGLCTCTPGATILLCPNGNPATDTCVDTSSSFFNCGACGHVCYPGETCSAPMPGAPGACGCASPKQHCGTGSATVCTDVQTDPKNCGTCGHLCPVGQECAAGACQPVCTTGLTLCNGACVDTRTDPANCGGCNISCGAGRSCVGGNCQAACTTLQCGGGTCCQAPLGNTCCANACPYQHKNFPGTTLEQTYYNCVNPSPWTVETAKTAAAVWAPPSEGGTLISSVFGCPTTAGSLCVVWRRNALIGSNTACAVFCYEGPFAGAATVTQGSTCACPTTQQIDWY